MLIRLAFILCWFPFFVLADEEFGATQWLEKMNLAMKQLNYQGTVAFVKNNQLDTMKYFHANNDGIEQERLLSLNSPMREVIREAGKLRCIFKESGKVVVDHRPASDSFIVDLPVNFMEMKDVYHFSLLGEASVAQHPVRIISIQARDKYRFGRKIWIDKQHFLPLKMEVFDLSGATLKQVVFTDLQVVNKLVFGQSEKNTEALDIKHIHQLESTSIEEMGVILGNIPPKFETIYVTRMMSDDSAHLVDHLLLSDGFSSISVYREAKAKGARTGMQSMGIFSLFTQVVGSHQITAMGEVPAKTVQTIAQGVSFR